MRPYTRSTGFAWWLTRRAYVLFVVRELTSVFIAAYMVVLLILLRRLAAGPEQYAAYLGLLRSPGLVAFHVVALAAAVYHSITWFSLAPKAAAVRLRGRRVRPAAVITANYALWLAASLVILWIVVGSGR